MYRHPSMPRPKPKPSAALEVMGRDWDPPFGSAGEWIVPQPHEPQPAPPQPFQPPPPDWEAEEAERRERGEQPAPTSSDLSAFESMMLEADARGELEERPAPGPVEQTAPIVPFVPPPMTAADWRALERERAEQKAAELAKPKTPNLDKIRSWLS
jgi:hypothetical protein